MIEPGSSKICNGNVASYFKQKFVSYVSNLPIEDSLRTFIADEEFIKNNPSFYLYYPKLFSSAFNELNIEDLDLLCIAGFLYYRSTLFLDSIVDNNSKKGLFLALICQEEATKIMTSIFGLSSSYWDFWNMRRQEFLKAIQMEKKFSENAQEVSMEAYSELADFKAAFGKSAIDALFEASGQTHKKEFKKLLLSHKYFSVAFQINDDVIDFREDYHNRQFNLAIKEIERSAEKSTTVDELNKLFYIRGCAKTLFLCAIENLDKALLEVKNIDVPLWKLEINKLRKKFTSSIIEIDNYLGILNSEINLSNQIAPKTTLIKSIENSITFVQNSQNEDGSWNEYINQGGVSNIWSTAFIASKLSGTTLKETFEAQLEKALTFLQNAKQSKIWGYNSTWISDADTTNFVLLSFFQNSIPIDKGVFEEWKEYYRKTSGFSTYKDPENLIKTLSDNSISDVTTWTSSHQCVSAVSFYFLTISGEFPRIHSELDILFRNKFSNDSVDSFWWTSSIYTLYFLGKSYNLLGEMDIVNSCAKKIAKTQNKDGSFSDKYGPNFFLTGLALEILMHNNSEFKNQIHKGVNFLLNNQYTDGSWPNSNALQIPDPAVEEFDKFYPVNSHGTSVRAREFNRLFTTVSILETLTIHEKTTACTAAL